MRVTRGRQGNERPREMDNLLPENFGKSVGNKDLTPTWRGVMPIIINSIMDGGEIARKAAIEELYRLADFADARREG